jgi:hypothetical protein
MVILQHTLALQVFEHKWPYENSRSTHYRDNSKGDRLAFGPTRRAAAVFLGRACVHATVRRYSLSMGVHR